MPSQMRIGLEKWLKTIDVQGSVVDIGGSQKLIKGRTKSWNATEYKTLDLDTPHENSQKPDIVCDLNTCVWSAKDSPIFDVAFCLEVMEYVWNPVQALKTINNYLAPKGTLYISFTFIYPLHPPHGHDLLRYTKYGALKLLEKTGFEILEYTSRTTDYIDVLQDYYRKASYKHDKQEDAMTLRETGCLIKARKL